MLVKANKLWPDGPSAQIPLNDGLFALCDPEWFDTLIVGHWYAKKSAYRFYAVARIIIKGKIKLLRMHRIVADTPRDQVCHHINGHSLDNRRANLLNMSEYEHTKMHSYR